MRILKYSGGYKYQVKGDVHFQTNIRGYEFNTKFLRLTKEGLFTIKSGYAYDGPSGPTVDTPIFIYGSLPHDAGYQAIREKLLPFEYWKMIDLELENAVILKIKEIHNKEVAQGFLLPDTPRNRIILRYRASRRAIHRGVWGIRLKWIMWGLERAGGEAADPRNRKKIYEI